MRSLLKKRWLVLSLGGFILLLTLSIFLVAYNAGKILKLAIETVGPQITQTDVKVGSVLLYPWAGQLTINKLRIGNPSNFKNNTDAFAISFSRLNIKIDPSTLTSPIIVLDQLLIQNAEVHWQGGPKNNNLNAIKTNIKTYLPSGSVPQRKFVIKDFVLKNTNVHLHTPIQDSQIQLPDIYLKKIGGEKGASIDSISGEILTAIIKSSIKALATTPGFLEKGLKSVKGIISNLSDILESR